MRIKEIKDNSLKTLEQKPRVADTRKVHRKKKPNELADLWKMELEGVREGSNRWLVDVENDPFPICLSPHSLITDGLEVCRQLLDRVAHVCRDLVLSFVHCDQHR